MGLSGNEIIEAQGVDGAGRPASGIDPVSTADISAFVAGNRENIVAQNVTVEGSLAGTLAVYKTNSATSATALTAANISGAPDVVLNLTGTLGAAANAQLPTVAALVAAIPNAVSGQSYRLRIINSSSGAFAWTVTTNTGWTLGGTMSVAQNTFRDFVLTLTSLTAATLQAAGTGTWS